MSKKNLVWKLEEGEEVGTYEGIETNCINCGMRIAIRSASVIPICPDCEETRDKERGRRGSD